ncbi:MAG: hypothetical protein ACWA5W_06165 [Phycisphaerales bacterium]
MALLYTGIDEAGYGPMLGPMCVAQSSFLVTDWAVGDPAPDFWDTLHEAIGKTKTDAKTRIAIGDSKKLKLANSTKTKHPLIHLERAVLAMLATRDGQYPTTDLELFERLGADLERTPWAQGGAMDLPLGSSMEQLNIDASHLRTVMNKHGVTLVGIRVNTIHVEQFNELYLTTRSKASATTLAMVEHLRTLESHRQRATHIRIVCDRQGGRTRYRSILSDLYPDIRAIEESPRASRYAIGDKMGILLTPKADDYYFPVALASMAAKLVRELMMMRFNRYWATRNPELKPTAGYVQDARRWLAEMQDEISAEERKAMVRLA